VQSERESINGVFDPVAAPRCQAKPAAFSQAQDPDDELCAATANRLVRFDGLDVPVCRMHEATYVRWNDEAVAVASWSWGTWTVSALAAIAAAAALISSMP
jgi:hypothetical protein